MAHSDYAPKRNPAADIADYNVRKLPLPAWMTRQDRPKQSVADLDALQAVHTELAEYIDNSPQEDAVSHQDVIEMVEPLTGIAKLIPEMSHREFKEWVGEAVLGVDMAKLTEEERRRIWETCDRVEAWSARKLGAAA